MLTPSYFFINDFNQFYDYFLTQPHIKKSFQVGEYLWESGEPFEKIHYIISGLAQNYVEHEDGHRKIMSFHGSGTVFPGYHQNEYKIEQSLITRVIYDMEVLEFTKADFQRMFETNPALSANVVEWFSKYTNLLIYETAHQEYNNSFVKSCNLLYLLLSNASIDQSKILKITQEELADILGISRVNITRSLSKLRNENIIFTHRKRIEIIDPVALAQYCSLETI